MANEKKQYTVRQMQNGEVKTYITVDEDDDIVKGDLNIYYCCTVPACLRIAEIILGFCLVSILCFHIGYGPFIGIFSGQTYVVVVACFLICMTFMFLLISCFNLNYIIMDAGFWKITNVFFNFFGFTAYLIVTGLEIWYSNPPWYEWNCQHNALFNQALPECSFNAVIAILAGIALVNTLLYLFGMLIALVIGY